MHDIAMAALSVFLMQSLALLASVPTRPACRSTPGSAGVPPAPGRRPAMDDPPKAHRCVQAGKPAPAWGRRGMPALPGVATADRVDLPGET